MFNPPHTGRRPASARRLSACLLATLFVLHQLAFIPAPAASAQTRQPRAGKRPPAVLTSPADTGAANISVTTLGSPLTQDFNTLASSGTANPWTDNSTLAGWYAQFGTTTNPTTYRASIGSENNGALYSYGPASNTDRALGSVGSGTTSDIYWAVQFTNNTGSTITSLDISYTGEQWRQGGCTGAGCAPAAQTVGFEYQVANAGTITDANTPATGWTAHDPLDFTSPSPGSTSTASALDGNAAANRTALSSSITGLSIAPGQEFWLRWVDVNHANNDHGLSIDDFSVTPQGMVVADAAPSVSSTVPADNATGVAVNSNISITFSEAVNVGSTWFQIVCGMSGTRNVSDTMVSTSDNITFLINPNTDFATGETCTVTVDDAQVTDQDATDPPDNMAADFVFDFTTAGGPPTPIHTIQGSGNASPLAGQTVTTTGIVTLLKTGSNAGAGAANGFFLQTPDADADADPNTSQGIFVFTSSVPTYTAGGAVAVGDELHVSGTVVEFNGLTEIGTVTNITSIDTGNPLPTAVTLDATILDPTAAPTQPQLEKYESMRMTAATLVSVAPNDNFFDVYAVLSTVARPMREPGIPASDPVPPDPTSGVPDCCIPIWDENPERIKIDTNGQAGSPNNPYTSNVTFTAPTGPLDFGFGEYRLVPSNVAAGAGPNMTAVAPPQPAGNEFTIASYNIENFNNNATQREKVSLTVRTLLSLPDIIGAVEIFDLADLQALRDEINNDAFADTGINPLYEAFLVEQDGTSEDNDQDVGFLVKTSRVSVTSVTQEREEETFEEPGGGTAILHDRPPLVLDAVVDPSGPSPQRVLVVVNHLRSFIDIELVAGDGPRVREKRKKQAESLADLLDDLQTANPGVPVISVGDYNAYQFSSGYDDSVSVLKGNPTPDDQIVVDQSPDLVDPNFFNLTDELPAEERYSFIFEGTPQGLDHHLVNVPARARNTRVAVARVNSDFPEAPAATYASNAAVPERNSDHDPVISYYALGAPQATGTLIINEFRFSGPNGDEDEFVELYNNTSSDITVATLDGSAGFALVTSNATVIHTVPNGTVIPARGHYLVANEDGYSLDGYAEADATYNTDITDGAGLALFRTDNPVFFDESNRLDAAGYASAGTLYREGAGIPITGAEINTNLQHSFLRHQIPGLPVDTGNNTTDFIGVDVTGANVGGTQRLGAPGPENLASPINRNGQIPGLLLDATKPASQSPNRVRDLTPGDPNTANFGTLSIRRRFVNNTGQTVSELRFRIAQISTFPAPAGTADLRALSSTGVTVSNIMDADTCATEGQLPPCTVDVEGATLDEPPTQAGGGGWNSSLSVPVTVGVGESVSVEFRLGVQQTGLFRFFINVEALTETVEEEQPLTQKASRFAPRGARPRRK